MVWEHLVASAVLVEDGLIGEVQVASAVLVEECLVGEVQVEFAEESS